MARQTPEEARSVAHAREQGRLDAQYDAKHRNDPPPPKPRSKWLFGCGSLAAVAVVVTLAYCGLSAVRTVKDAATKAVAQAEAAPAAPSKAVPAAPRYAVATVQISRTGNVEGDIVSTSLWPFDGGTLLLIVKVRGLPAGSDYPAKWVRSGSDATLRPEGGGPALRRVLSSKTLDAIPATADGCALLFEVGAADGTAYALDLSVGGGRSLRFRLPPGVQTPGSGPLSVTANDPFTRTGPPVDAGK